MSKDDFWGDLHDVGGFTIFTDAAGEEAEGEEGDSNEAGVYNDQELFNHYDNQDHDHWERSSFCEVCFIHFKQYFVEWCYVNRNNKPFYLLKEGLTLGRPYSTCKRCAQPQARVLWAWLSRHVMAKSIATYWWRLAHAPAYAATHAALMAEDMWDGE